MRGNKSKRSSGNLMTKDCCTTGSLIGLNNENIISELQATRTKLFLEQTYIYHLLPLYKQ